MKCPYCDCPRVIEICISPHEFECRGCGRTIYEYGIDSMDDERESDIDLKVKLLHGRANMPTRAHTTDAGLDLYTCENGVIHANSDAVIKTGIAIAIPDGYVGIVKEKSGRAVKNKLTVGACVIDSGYRGELLIHLFNNQSLPVTYSSDEAIAQLVIIPCWMGEPMLVTELDETDRGEGKFGSTGVSHIKIKKDGEVEVNHLDGERIKLKDSWSKVGTIGNYQTDVIDVLVDNSRKTENIINGLPPGELSIIVAGGKNNDI